VKRALRSAKSVEEDASPSRRALSARAEDAAWHGRSVHSTPTEWSSMSAFVASRFVVRRVERIQPPRRASPPPAPRPRYLYCG